jgi:hypothetical protein
MTLPRYVLPETDRNPGLAWRERKNRGQSPTHFETVRGSEATSTISTPRFANGLLESGKRQIRLSKV